MKKILFLFLIGVSAFCFAKDIKEFSGSQITGQLPDCYTIMCPECSRLRARGKSNGGIAVRTDWEMRQDEDGEYICYHCNFGHRIRFYYKVIEVDGKPKSVPLK